MLPPPLRAAACAFALLFAVSAPARADAPWSSRTWMQRSLDARRAVAGAAAWPEVPERLARASASVRSGVVPLALLDAHASAPDGSGATVPVFGFAALSDRTLHGAAVTFALAPDDFVSDDPRPLTALAIDFDDGRGFRTVGLGERVTVAYATPGPRTLRVRVTRLGGDPREASAAFTVAAVAVRAPDETLHVTGAAFNGVAGTGDAYVYRAPGHATIVDPVVVPEGFDIDNTMNADELFTLLDQQGLADSLAARGMDVIVLNFADATDDLRRNAQVLITLEQQVEAGLPPGRSVAMVGPSMGGLLARYALAWLETHGIGHHVRALFSFDGPHGGANIPLGVQHWVDFFANQSSDAAFLRDRLNTAGARQMLLFHFTQPGAAPDPLRADWNAALAAAGGWPTKPLLYGVANGNGTRQNQGFAPGAQLIKYEYDTGIIKLTGDVWALPDHTSQTVFTGLQRVFFITNASRTVTVNNTAAWDGAPGGWRGTMAQMDSVTAPYGDIIALHPNHCFIPTVSALALATSDPFYDVAGDPDLLAHTPYAEILVAPTNEEHVSISPAEAAWFLARIGTGITGVAPNGPSAAGLRLAPPAPNPSHGAARLDLTLASDAHATLDVLTVDGRRVARLFDGSLSAGPHAFRWDGRDAAGARAPSGLYFVRLQSAAGSVSRRLVRLD
jgi:hypothetical protein